MRKRRLILSIELETDMTVDSLKRVILAILDGRNRSRVLQMQANVIRAK